MKRFLTFLAAIMMVMIAMAQSSGIVLSYNKGKELKFYASDKLNDAINDAEVNDTIYFGPGVFELVSTITKPLTFIGSGAHSEGTYLMPADYNSNDYRAVTIQLKIDSQLDKSKKTISFEGMNIAGNYYHEVHIQSSSDIEVLKFVNVRLNDFKDHESYVIGNFILDRCCLEYLDLGHFTTKHVSVNNTKFDTYPYGYVIGGCDSSYGVATFDHCYIHYIRSSFVGLIKHSIINTTYAGSDAALENCLWYKDNGDSSKTDCKNLNHPNIYDYESLYSEICSDNTVYGTRGGETPYTYYPQYPTADTSDDPDTGKAKSYLEYDALNKKLTIKVKRLGE